VADLINQIVNFIEEVIQVIGYPGVFAALFLENVFPPIPTEGLLPVSGIVAAEGKLTYLGVIVAAVLGAVLGSLLLYGIGMWADERFVRGLVRRYGRLMGISEQQLDVTLRKFRQYGAPIILFGRSLPVMRSVLSLAAGMSRMRLPTFVFFTAASSTASSFLWVTLGYVLGDNWRLVLGLIDQFEPFIIIGIVLVLAVIALFLARRLIRGRMLLHHDPGTPAD
jgi:membrane protein DedA with SNARE-associated domain